VTSTPGRWHGPSHAGHKTSAEWLAALISRSQAVNNAARDYLNSTEPAQATA
jgi:hypothetical protein